MPNLYIDSSKQLIDIRVLFGIVLATLVLSGLRESNYFRTSKPVWFPFNTFLSGLTGRLTTMSLPNIGGLYA